MKAAVIILALLINLSAYGQQPGVKYKQDDMITFYHEISKYELKNTDTLVDIGSGTAKHAELIFRFFPQKHYVLVDINPIYKKLPVSSVNVKGKRYTFDKQSDFFLGSDSTIPLPSSAFRRILCRQTFHEFSKPVEMLAEIRRIMTDDALLIVEESIPEYENQVDQGCKHLYWKKEEIVKVFEANGFVLIASDVTMYNLEKAKGNLNILKFKKGVASKP